MKPVKSPDGKAASVNITKRIKELGDWRGDVLALVRKWIKEAVPGVVEEWKWRGVPVWELDGIICTGETYKDVVKLTFARGAELKDPKKLFNASLEGQVRRAIDIREDDTIAQTAFKQLILAAVVANSDALAERTAKKRAPKKSPAKVLQKVKEPTAKKTVRKRPA